MAKSLEVSKREAAFPENSVASLSETTVLSQRGLMSLPLVSLVLQHDFIRMVARNITASTEIATPRFQEHAPWGVSQVTDDPERSP